MDSRLRGNDPVGGQVSREGRGSALRRRRAPNMSPKKAPHQLLAQDGLYAQMWNRQREATEAEEQLRRTTEDPDGFVKRGLPAAE